MTVNLIAAVASDGAIGKDNSLLWHLPADMKYFRAVTMGHPVIMGRRTFQSIGRALPGRLNVVISRSRDLSLPEGVVTVHSLEEALELFKDAPGVQGEPFVIGGGQIYARAIAAASAIYITRIDATAEGADTFFPPVPDEEWELESRSEAAVDEKSGLEYRFEKYVRK